MSSSAIERSLKNIRSEMEFLRDEKFLSPEQYQQVASVLSTLPAQSNNQSRPPVQTPDQSKSESGQTLYAMYDWQGHEPSDLNLHKGDRIELTEKLNNDWWRGKCNGQEGCFPSNFVSENANFDKHQSGEYISAPHQYEEKEQYQPPSYYGAPQQQQQNYPPQQQQYYQQGGPQQYYQQQQGGQPPFVQQAQQPDQQQQGAGHGGQFRKFGSKFGNAAIWGAGATLGSDLINSIF